MSGAAGGRKAERHVSVFARGRDPFDGTLAAPARGLPRTAQPFRAQTLSVPAGDTSSQTLAGPQHRQTTLPSQRWPKVRK